jgi:endonuclease/exonuclease/phosphatase family metal-dependent hydrolase
MKRYLLLIFFLFAYSYAKNFSIISYNVENLFDNFHDGSEYNDFKPNSKYWNTKSAQIKYLNTLKVIEDLNSDIIILQEIENKSLLEQLNTKLKYKYKFFHKKHTNAIGQGILSNIPIINTKIIKVSSSKKYRDIIKLTFKIENKPFVIYANHWSSKRHPSSTRIKSAYKLMEDIKTLPKNIDYMIIGDLNENYDEFLTLKHNKKIDDTQGLTAINQILNTTINNNFVQKPSILSHNQIVHFNPWLELANKNRFSTLFKKRKNTPDNILLSATLFDNTGISYIQNSFEVIKFPYLYTNNKINRWNKYNQSGYSDHLPIKALFSTNKLTKINTLNEPKQQINSIKDLYNYNALDKEVTLENVYLIYKAQKFGIFKRKNDRAIQVFHKDIKNLKLAKGYTINIKKLDTYFNNLQINDFKIHKELLNSIDVHTMFKDGNKINLFDENFQGEVINNLKGKLIGKDFYFEDKKINIYFKKGVKKPKENMRFLIHAAILSKFKTTTQLTIYSNDDFTMID